MVWYSHLLNNCPQFIVIHTVKGFGIVNEAEVNGFLELVSENWNVVSKAEVDVFLELSCLVNDPMDVGNLISGSSVFSETSLN